MKKFLASALSFAVLFCLWAPFRSLAVNDDFDNPEDFLVSQNEAVYDLMADPPADLPNITGTSYILLDATSDTVLMGRNIDSRVQPAAVTKLMTALLAFENLELDDTITITQPMYIGIRELFHSGSD